MPLAPKSMQDMEQQGIVTEAAAIREQLHRLLAHPLFANSKRYPALLAYTVEETLKGNAAELKERSIGIEVFGRAPTYDANADPVVRITAGEVRKRLSLYYYDSSHTGEVVIELPLGTYIPIFRQPELPAEQPVENHEFAPFASTPVLMPQVAQAASPASSATARKKPARWKWLAAGTLVIAGCAAGVFVGMQIKPTPVPVSPSNIDRFWEPFTSSSNPTTFCLGEPAKNIDMDSINSFEAPLTSPADPQKLYVRLHLAGLFALADVTTLTRAAAAIEARQKTFRILPASE